MRLIDADALIDRTDDRYSMHEIGRRERDDIVNALEYAPTIEPERKRGKWILHENQRQEDVNNGNYLYACSECGKSDIHAKTQEVPFCWWCGADMRGTE